VVVAGVLGPELLLLEELDVLDRDLAREELGRPGPLIAP
jgi:hypothetical protein